MAATGYEIRKDGSTIIDVGNVLTYDAAGLNAETAYNFEVRAYDAQGNRSAWTSIVSATTYSSPASLPGLTKWHKASLEAYADNDPVGIATGQGGTSNSTASGSARPTFKTSIVNGKAVYRFDGSDDFFSLGDLSALTEGEMFIVIKIDNDPPAGTLTAGAWYLGTGTSSFYPWSDGVIYDTFGSTARKTVGNPTPSLASWRIYNVWSAANDWSAQLDGVTLFSTGTNTVAFRSACRLGSSPDDVAFLDGDVPEFFLCNQKLSAGNRANMLIYLQAEYGL